MTGITMYSLFLQWPFRVLDGLSVGWLCILLWD